MRGLIVLVICVSTVASYKRTVGELEEKVNFTVSEGQPAGTLIGRIYKRPGYSYKLNERNPNFTFDPSTGDIKTMVELDREALPSDRTDLLIVGSSPTYFITVIINVIDINDNAPQFSFPYQNVSLAESAKLNTRIVLAGARDKDSGDNGLIGAYQIVDGNSDNSFKLVSLNSSESDNVLFLELIKPLDRELKSVYTLNVSATDKGQPARTGYCVVNVNVLDSNDNPPMFENNQYYASVNENIPTNSFVVTVSATDKDIGDNGRIRYKISNDDRRQFRVDETSGVIYVLKSPLVCRCSTAETNCTRICVITVEAYDSGTPAQIGRAFVNVRLINENNHQPEISFRYYPAGADYVSLEESKPIGTVAAVVTVTDSDSGDNGRISVSIASGDELGHFKLESNDLFSLIRTNTSLDHAKVNAYNLTVVARDYGNPPKSTSKLLRIFVTDPQDTPPEFETTHYSAKVLEKVPIGSYVISVRALPKTLGKNRRIVYKIVAGDIKGRFAINPSTGLIATAAPLVYEEGRLYNLTIAAKDVGPSLNGSFAFVTVEVLNVDEQVPQFGKSDYNITVAENAPVGTPLITLALKANMKIQYAIVDDGRRTNVSDSDSEFNIDSNTGVISVAKGLDRERKDFYKLHVVAFQPGQPHRSSSCEILINVQDVNDHAPHFYPSDYYINVRKDETPGAYMARVGAQDEDQGLNGAIDYFIHQAPIGSFDVDQHTGVVMLKRSPFGRRQVDVVLGAKDGAGALAINNATVHVYICDDFTSLPKFLKASYEFSIKEDDSLHQSSQSAQNGKVIGTVSATDFDSSAKIQYIIVDGDEFDSFAIGQYSGEIRSSKLLDYEFRTSYQLTVAAIGTRGITSTQVNVNIEDINDNIPTFEQRRYVISAEKGTAVGQPIFFARALDSDSGINGEVRYSILPKSDIFAIDKLSGSVTFAQPPYKLSNSTFTILIAANDLGSPPLNDTMTLSINIVGSYDNSKSLFAAPLLQYDISESTLVNTLLFRLNITDTLSVNRFMVTFESVPTLESDLFGVFPDGMVFVKNELDYESSHFFELSVRASATDNDGSTYSSTATVYMQILDANDNSPQFTNDSFIFHLPEGSELYSFVGTIEATDGDSGLQGLVSYQLLDDNSHSSLFKIDSSSGVISSAVIFDREKMIKYDKSTSLRLIVEATDHGSPPLSTTCSVEVIITDINDNAPYFTLDYYAANVYENADIGFEIMQFSANDEDALENAALKFFITNGNDNETFWLNETSGQLFVRKPLDRESVNSYHLALLVKDSGTPSLNDSAFAVINTLDINDNAPQFTYAQASAKLSERTDVGSVVTTLSATDKDVGAAGVIKYYLQAGNIDRTFELDPVSGELLLIRKLDYESVQNYSLSVVAADEGTPGLSTQTVINVEVTDENDNAPVISPSSLLGRVFENSAQGTSVITVSATDTDKGLNGQIRFDILKQVPSNAFSINPISGVISLGSTLDRRQASTFKLLLEAKDQASNESQRLSTEKFVTIVVTRSEELSKGYGGPRAAAVPSGYANENKLFSLKPNYQISGADKDSFTLSTDGGLYLRPGVKLNKPIYRFSVDTANPKVARRSVQTTPFNNSSLDLVVITKSDNNKDISFEKSDYKFDTPSNIAIGTEIGRIRAKSNTGSRLEYYITKIASDISNLPLLVDVDAFSGSLRVERQLDTELGPITSFMVEIYAVTGDSAQPNSGSCLVTVEVLAPKDAPPKFTEDSYEFQISEDAQVGSQIGLVAIVNNNTLNRVTFDIDNKNAPFAINQHTGVITTRYLLDREVQSAYTLVATVSDGVYSNAAFVRIELNDINDNAPKFLSERYQFRVYEGSQLNSFVGAVDAKDLDSGQNGMIEYSFESSATLSMFNIDRLSGVITVNGNFDAEQIPIYNISVIATDKGYQPKKSAVNIYVEILDINDNNPTLEQNVFKLDLKEDAPIGYQLLQLSPSDQDAGTEFAYEIVAGDPQSLFSVDRDGRLMINGTLDHEMRIVHQLQIAVYDAPVSSAIRNMVMAEVTVTLLDVNDNAPRFVLPNVVYVMENSPLGTLVTNLGAIDPDDGENGIVEYSADPSFGGAPSFTVDPVSGQVLVAGPLDREIIDTYYVTVLAIDHGESRLTSSMNLTIRILDDEDNKPSFVEKFHQLTVNEDLSIGQTLLQLGATDKDINENAALKFWVDSGDRDNDFTVSPDTGVLSAAHPLNYERVHAYNLTLSVANLYDTSYQSADKSTIILNVADINDNAPTFPRNPVYFQAAENFARVPAAVGRAEAMDPDSGLNGKLSYSITQGNTSLFSIDSLTGEIKLNGILDRELVDLYKLTIQVSDSGNPRLTGTGTIVVSVIDLNDNAPQFEKPYYQEHIKENQPVGSFVCQVHANDADIGKNGQIKYSFASDHSRSVPFSIDDETGVIRTKSILDRELVDKWNLLIIARDQADGPQLENNVTVIVRIEDENDNAPVIKNTKPDVFVRSPTNAGDFVYVIDAYDIDDGLNGKLKFNLSGKDAKYFSINESTGVIRTMQASLHLESYAVDISVADGGVPSLQTLTSIRLYFRTPADFPQFQNVNNNSFSTPEDRYNTVIGTFNSRSPKQAPFNRVMYGIVAGNSNSAFVIDADSGALSSTSHLDFERQARYELYITSVDNDNPQLTSFLPITVNLIDVNDNRPEFVSSVYQVKVIEEEEPPINLIRVKAFDADSGPNGQIEYRFISTPQTDDYFEIDKKTGQISTTMQIDREKISKFNLIVVAEDKGRPQLSSTASVQVIVDDINDNAPKFTRLFSASIAEDAAVGTFVTQVTSSDADSVENANNTYYLASNQGSKFAIDPYSGNVTVIDKLDRETISEYSLKVVAVDGAWRVETSLSITVNDINDNAPIFSSPIYMFNVSEKSPGFTTFGKVSASDADAIGLNSRISYRLKQKSSFFVIDTVTGVLSAAKSLMYHQNNFAMNFYQLTIVAQDFGRPSLSSSTLVVVRLLESNSNPPKFDKPSYKFAIPLVLAAGDVVGRVSATDVTAIGYKIEQPSNFTVHSSSGLISSVKPLTSAAGQSYHITVVAFDYGAPSKSSSVEVITIALEPNRNAPEFTSKSYSSNIREDSFIGTVILSLSARDADDGLNAEVEYHLENKTSLFALNETTGVLTLNGQLDYEKATVYNLKVVAADKGYISKNSSAFITVMVTDVDDNGPAFTSNSFTCEITENVPTGTFVCKVNATDADGPPFNYLAYSFCDEPSDQTFAIRSDSGKVFTNGNIDFERKQLYHYSLCASNANGSLSSKASLKIYVNDENEFWPKFDKREYNIVVPELSQIGLILGSVHATDGDQGADGQVFYFIENITSLSSAIKIDRLSGALTVAHKINRPVNNNFSLMVGAHNQQFSSIEEVDFARVTFTFSTQQYQVPKFARQNYSIQIAENSAIGTTLLSVTASAYAGATNFYSIDNSSIGHELFTIDEKTGLLKVNGAIDREVRDHYNLTILASSGKGDILSASCFVSIVVIDVNDNAPYLPPSRSFSHVLENAPIGTNITRILPEDQDLPANGPPFNFSLVANSDDSSFFEVNQVTGVIKTKKMFDREKHDQYNIHVSITDNGQPRQTANVQFTIFIDDINDNPSFSESVDMQILTYGDNSFSGVAGPAKPADLDLLGDYNCSIKSQSENLFTMDTSCLLNGVKLSTGITYHLNIDGNDGVHVSVNYNATVSLNLVANETLNNVVLVQISPIENYQQANVYQDLLSLLSKQNVHTRIVSFTPESKNASFQTGLILLDNQNKTMSKEIAARFFQTIQHDNSSKLSFAIDSIESGHCQLSPCANGGHCFDNVVIDSGRNFLELKRTVYSLQNLKRSFTCECAEGFGGKLCEQTLDKCALTVCHNGGTCVRSPTGKSKCECSPGFEGTLCQNDIDECSTIDNLCLNGGYCENTNGSYKCICLMGFTGPNCRASGDGCASDPCTNGGRCEKVSTIDYKCICKFGYSGKNCESGSIGFDEMSFLELKPFDKNGESKFTFEFATLKSEALMVYAYNKRNYFILDMLNGSMRLLGNDNEGKSFELRTTKEYNDGKWYRISLVLESKFVAATVGLCVAGETHCATCPNDNSECYLRTPLDSKKSILTSNNILFGGLRNFDDLVNKPRQLTSASFVGCMRNIAINNATIEEHGLVDKANLLDFCPRPEEPPCFSSKVCDDAQQCIDKWSRAICQCNGGFLANSCQDAAIASSFNGGFVTYELSEAFRRKSYLKSPNFLKSVGNAQRPKRSTRPAEHWIQFDFRTTSKDGLLMFAASGEEFSLIDISNDTLRYMSKVTDSNPTQMYLSGANQISDGEWHTVSLALFDDARSVELKLDESGKEAKSPFSVHVFLSSSLHSLSIGGTAESVKIFGSNLSSFNGCIRRFIVDGQLQPLSKGNSDIFDVYSNGAVSVGCAGSVPCISPPCSAVPLSSSTVGASVAAVLVFFGCLIASSIIAYFVVKRIRRRKSATTRSTPEPQLDTKRCSFNQPTGNYSGSTKDSGIVVGDSREVLNRDSSCSQLSTEQQYKRNMFPPYISNPILPVRDSWPDKRLSAAERYDLDNASSLAPSDTDVAYHYRGYRNQGTMEKAVRSTVVKNGTISSSRRQSPASAKLKSSMRSTPTSNPSRDANTPSTSDEDYQREQRRRPSSTKSSRSKRRTASEPRKDTSLKRNKKRRSDSHAAITPLSSVNMASRFDHDDSSSVEGDYSKPMPMPIDYSQPPMDFSQQPRDYKPPLPRRLTAENAAYVPTSDSESAACSELDLDQVRKPRRLIRPPGRPTAEETETESETCPTGAPVTLAAFRCGPRSMFPVSEDESDMSVVNGSAPNRQFLSRIANMDDHSTQPNMEAYV